MAVGAPDIMIPTLSNGKARALNPIHETQLGLTSHCVLCCIVAHHSIYIQCSHCCMAVFASCCTLQINARLAWPCVQALHLSKKCEYWALHHSHGNLCNHNSLPRPTLQQALYFFKGNMLILANKSLTF